MSKIDISKLPDILTEEGVDKNKQEKILEHIQEILKAEKEEKEENKTPKAKNEFGVVLFAPELVGKEYTACIYQIKDGDDHSTVLKRISEACHDQNSSKKSKKKLIDSIGGAFQNLKRKWVKEKNINFKTKESVRVLITDNKLV
jgi:hypothetical protein